MKPVSTMPIALMAEMPPWFLEALGGVGTCAAYIFGRISKQDVSESKLASLLDTVSDMGDGVKKMGEASAARQEQIAQLQESNRQLWAEIGKLRAENSSLSGQLQYLKGQVGK